MESLPCDVLSDIFIRLLAKQLAQMRCVCKSWNALLSESFFIKSHLRRSNQNNNGILLHFHQELLVYYNPMRGRPIRFHDLKSTNSIKLPVNPQSKNDYGRVIGSVNGLICFKYGSHHDDYAIYIWNPSLSAVLTLPPCSSPSRDSKDTHFQFGFDPKTDDYKVVKVTRLSGSFKILPQVEVYSMRKGSWDSIGQRVETFPSHVTNIFDKDTICTAGRDGHLRWLGYVGGGERDYETIVAFDLGGETFYEMPLPESLIGQHAYRWNILGVLNGKFCMMSRIYHGKCEVWVMEEYGVAESWVKYQDFPELKGDVFPNGFTSHNEFLFNGNSSLCLYDPIAAQSKAFKIMNRNHTQSPTPTTILEYVDSLVWVAPAKHELSKGQVLISNLNNNRN